MREIVDEFEVQVRNNDDGLWEASERFLPQYEYKTETTHDRFLWWTWTSTAKSITNKKDAVSAARKKATAAARQQWSDGHDSRLFIRWRVVYNDGTFYTYDTLLWDRGDWTDN